MEDEENTTGEVFSSLKIWRAAIAKGLSETPNNDDWKLRLCLEESQKVEQAVFGSLKEAMHDLMEAVAWGLYTKDTDVLEQQRQMLLNQAHLELLNDKNLITELARENGIFDAYVREIKKSINHSLASYTHVGELRFCLTVWRTNLLRDTSLASTPDEIQSIIKDGYLAVLRAIKRCANQSKIFWERTRHTHGLTESTSTSHVYEQAMGIVKTVLTNLASQHGLHQEFLEDELYNKVAGPNDMLGEQDTYEDVEGERYKAVETPDIDAYEL